MVDCSQLLCCSSTVAQAGCNLAGRVFDIPPWHARDFSTGATDSLLVDVFSLAFRPLLLPAQ